jgi:hypothetical protein
MTQLPPAITPFENGWYEAMIINSAFKKTAAGTGSYLSLDFEFQDSAGAQAGTMCWVNLNLYNPNSRTVRIARRQLDDIREAIGLPDTVNHEELRGIPLMVHARRKAATEKYPESIELFGFKKCTSFEIDFDSKEEPVKSSTKSSNAEPFEDDIPF